MKNFLNDSKGGGFRRVGWRKAAMLICAGVACLATAVQGQVLFSDDFTRTNDPAPITPWLIPGAAPSAWSITGGTMQSGVDTPNSYGYVYVTNQFTNSMSVQGQFKYSSAGGWGGGIGGYVNTATGAHYAAWIYPDSSAGGGSAVRLIKFSTWTSFGYLGTNFGFMAVANVGTVGTTNHTLKMTFATNTITVVYDGTNIITTTDAEAGPYTNGAASLDMFTDTSPYTFTADNVQVSAVSATPVAVNDSYSVATGKLLTVAAPGVLANDTGGNGPLITILATNVAHGVLNLSSNGGFTYTSATNYSGPDTFSYKANDGHTNSSNALVTITVTPDHAPVAIGDSYTIIANTSLQVATPGILANDTDSDGDTLTAALVSTTTNGLLTLTNNGGFGYVPTNNFSGTDTFTYKANDGISNSANATVTVSVLPTSTLFFDNFVRATDPGPLTPWVAQAGNWTVTGGTLDSGINTMQTYAFAYLTNVWTNFSVQGQVQFSTTNAWGGGIGGRLNSGTGAHYGAWVYPENSAGGGNAIRLIKFSSYSSYGYLGTNFGFMGETNLAGLGGVGTGLHTVKLGFLGNQISVYYDGTQVLSVTDTEVSPNTAGGVTADMWTDLAQYDLTIDKVVVSALANNDSYSVNGGTTLSVSTPGVLANDTPVLTTGLTASQVTGPAHGSLTLNANGSFNYTPTNGYSGQDSFTYRANDGSTNIGTATVNINVIFNGPSSVVFAENFDGVATPSLPSGWSNAIVTGGTNWKTVTVSNNTAPNSVFASEPSVVGISELITPSIALLAGPCQLTFKNNYNLEIDSTNATDGYDGGILEIKIGTNAFTDIVTAGGSFLAGGYNTIISSIFNSPFAGRPAWSGNSHGFITTTVDLPPAASGQTILLKWRCGTDSGSTAVGWWIDTVSISNCPSSSCWNTAPVLPAQTNQTVNEQLLLTVTNTATDGDGTNNLGYSLISPPTGASIVTNTGIITWTPAQNQSPGTYTITTRVVDNGIPPLAATNSFSVTVKEVNIAPVLPGQTTKTNFGLATLTVTNTATEPNIHATATNYVLVSPPTGMTISTNGIITWTPTTNQIPNSYTITTVVTNNDTFDLVNTHLSATNSFTVVTATVHNGPTLPSLTPVLTNNELVPLTVNNTATDSDVPVLGLTYVLTNSPPAGATISTNGIITWTPSQNQSPSTNIITTVVTDNGTPAKSATNSFQVVVREINVAPTLPALGTNTVNELALLTLTSTAAESNIHSFATNYTLVAPLAGMSITTNGIFTWTPSQSQSPSTNTVTVVVTNSNPFDTNNPKLSATTNFTVIVREVNVAPTLPVIAPQTVNEQVLLSVTTTATETNIHAVTTGYSLTSPLPGMSITTNGIFTWTPAQNQSPSTNTVTVVVTNRDNFDLINPVLTASSTFSVIVKEVNIAPTLPVIAPQTVNEQTLLTVTNTAIEPNVHAVTTGYSLTSPLAGMSIDTNGIFTWTPAQNQSSSTNVVTVVVTNNDVFDTVNPQLTATRTFSVIVKEINIAPTLPGVAPQTVNEQTLLTVTNTATEPNNHAVTTGYGLVSPLLGMSIDTNGVFTWTPTQSQSPSTNLVTIVVTNNDSLDTVNPVLTATSTFTVIVKEINIAPVLPVISPQTANLQNLLIVTNTATEPNIHAATISYTLVSPPLGMSIDTNGIITWTPQNAGSNLITTVVTNLDSFDLVNPMLAATNTFTVVVQDINIAPQFPVIDPQTVNEQTLLMVTNTVTEPNPHSVTTGYALISPLLGMSIDTNGIFTWTPAQTQSPGTNTVTVVATNNDSSDPITPVLMATNTFTVIVKEINIAPTLPVIAPQTVNEQTQLTVTNTATEPNIHAVTTGYSLTSPLAGMSIDTNGIFTWTPSQNQSPGTNVVTVVVTNSDAFDSVNPTLTATSTFTVIVKEINIAPILPVIAPQTVSEQTLLTVTNTATEPNIHAVTTGYSLTSPLAGMSISTNGIFTWTPSQSQSPGTNVVTVVVTNSDTFDSVNPTLTATSTFTVIVKEINVAPILPVIAPQTVNEQTLVTVTNTATEPNIHAVTTGYSLTGPLAGMSIDTNGIFTWTPSQNQSPGTNVVTVVVTNSDAFDSVNPTLTATSTFTVIVKEINVAPILPVIAPQTVNEQTLVTVTNTATEPNIHAVTTGYSLTGPLAGMSIDTNGIFTWTPSQNQSPGTNVVTVVVTNSDAFDSVNPTLTATSTFTVIVKEINVAPILPVIAPQTVSEQTLLTVTNTATEPNIHAVTTGYSLTGPLAGMSIDTNGIFTWTPSQNQSPGTNVVTVVVTNSDAFDSVNPTLTATSTFTVIVKEINVAPILPVIAPQTVSEQTLLTVTNTATEPNIHAVTTGYSLTSPLAGMSISTNGIFTWTPSQSQSPGTNVVTVVVTNSDTFDSVNPTLTATSTFTVIVKEINVAPILPVIAPQTVSEQTLLTVTNTATEPNIHAVTTGYSLTGPLAGMSIDTNGIFTWTPAQSQSPGTNVVTVVVTNSDTFDSVNPTLTATSTFTVIVKEINVAPILPLIAPQTVNEQTLLTVTNTATEPNIHAVTTGYSLTGPLAGMSIDTNGIFTWTPAQSQSPGTNVVTVVVTNSDTFDSVNPTLTATSTFTVIVKEVNIAPTLPVITPQAVTAQSLIMVTNTATEPNIHAMTTGYGLVSPLLGMSIDTNGIFTWTPAQNQSPSTNVVTVVVTNNDAFDLVNPTLTATSTFTVVVNAGTNNTPPTTIQTITASNGIVTLTWNSQAGRIYRVQYKSGIASTNWGHLFPDVVATNTVCTATDVIGGTQKFYRVVLLPQGLTNTAPVLSTQSNRTMTVSTQLTVTNTATDNDVPTNSLTYQLVNGPVGATIAANGVITWTPQSVGTNIITTLVFDDGVPAMAATNSFQVVVSAPNTNAPAPVIQSIVSTGGSVILTWSSVSGISYRAQYKDSLATTNWIDIAPDVAATNTTASATNAVSAATQRFFRIRLLP